MDMPPIYSLEKILMWGECVNFNNNKPICQHFDYIKHTKWCELGRIPGIDCGSCSAYVPAESTEA